MTVARYETGSAVPTDAILEKFEILAQESKVPELAREFSIHRSSQQLTRALQQTQALRAFFGDALSKRWLAPNGQRVIKLAMAVLRLQEHKLPLLENLLISELGEIESQLKIALTLDTTSEEGEENLN